MKIISHRGNLTGPNPEMENRPEYIEAAIAAGFEVEIDLWGRGGALAFGHDQPQFDIGHWWIEKRAGDLWIHCKDFKAEHFCIWANMVHWFTHEGMPRVTTSTGQTWHYPGATLQGPMPIACLPETVPDWDISDAWGICTDYPMMYRAAIRGGFLPRAGMYLCAVCGKPAVNVYTKIPGCPVLLCEDHKDKTFQQIA